MLTLSYSEFCKARGPWESQLNWQAVHVRTRQKWEFLGRRVFKLDFPSRDCFKIRHYFRRRTSQMEMKLPFEQRPWKKRAAQEPSAVGAYGTECNPLLIRLWYTQEPRQIFITVVSSWRKAAFAKRVKSGDSRATAFPNQIIEIRFFSHTVRLRAQDWWVREPKFLPSLGRARRQTPAKPLLGNQCVTPDKPVAWGARSFDGMKRSDDGGGCGRSRGGATLF